MNFEEALLEYKKALGQYERGEISAERFEEIVNRLQLTDTRGQFWQIGVKTGKWYRFDGQNWVEDVPQEFEQSYADVPAKAAFVPPAPAEPRHESSHRNQKQPRGRRWLSGFLIAGILGLCCVLVGVGGWLIWSSDLLPIPSVAPVNLQLASPLPPATTLVASLPVPSRTPLTAPSTSSIASVLFQDDFSDPQSGWDDIRAREEANTYYFEDEYRFLINQADFYAWSNPQKSFTGDVQVEVDAKKTSGSQFDEFGLLCRYVQNSDGTSSYYYFAIAVDGLGVIYKVDHDEKSLAISNPPKKRADVIHPDDQINRIRADCIGDRLSLYVNDEFLIDAFDPSLGNGDVGLRADSETGASEIHFDNFVVYKPGR